MSGAALLSVSCQECYWLRVLPGDLPIRTFLRDTLMSAGVWLSELSTPAHLALLLTSLLEGTLQFLHLQLIHNSWEE